MAQLKSRPMLVVKLLYCIFRVISCTLLNRLAAILIISYSKTETKVS